MRRILLGSWLCLLTFSCGSDETCLDDGSCPEAQAGNAGAGANGGTSGTGGSGGSSASGGTGGSGGSAGSTSDGGACDTSASPGDQACLIDEAFGVFVSAKDGDDDGADGTRAKPYATLAKALEQAKSENKK